MDGGCSPEVTEHQGEEVEQGAFLLLQQKGHSCLSNKILSELS